MGWQDWLSIVLGIIGLAAFVMAIPPFIAMIWGGPKLSSMLSLESNSSGAILMYTIWNDPVTKGVLHTLRIRRATAEDVWVSVRIIEEPSGKQVFSAMPVINTATGFAARRVSLPPSTLGGHFGIAIADANGKGVPRIGNWENGAASCRQLSCRS
jgi:hypothetical protein